MISLHDLRRRLREVCGIVVPAEERLGDLVSADHDGTSRGYFDKARDCSYGENEAKM